MVKNPMREQLIVVHHNILSSGLNATAIAVYLHLSATDKLDVQKIITLLDIAYADFDEAMRSLIDNQWISQDCDDSITINDNPFKD